MATLPRSSNPRTATGPPLPELRRHLSFATSVPSSPELRRHLTFATRAPSSPELPRHLSFATRAPRSPEFHLLLDLRRHPRFTTRDPHFQSSKSSTELRRRLCFAPRAPPAPEIRRHLSSELRDHSSTFHLSSTSIFRDYHIQCRSPSSHYQRQGTFLSAPQPPALSSSPPSAPTI